MAITIVSIYLLCVAIVLLAICLSGTKKNGIKDEEE